jgi:hypothetical protein
LRASDSATAGARAGLPQTLGQREFEVAFDALAADMPFNCEHIVPQSW